MTENLDEEIEDELGDASEEIIPFKYSITSYGADYPVDGLVKRISKEDIYIPSFQRGFVWNLTQASRFIESLLLGLPVPGIFLAKEEDTQKLLVIDGQQRLRTLQYFYGGLFSDTGREFALKSVQPAFNGLTYRTLHDHDRRRLDDSILHATVVKQDEPSEDNSSVYHIFERLNTGGLQLHPQEIRACIYHGPFNDLLKKLNMNTSWRAICGPVSPRMRDHELILRFLALYFNADGYSKPMKAFLNTYMGKNKHLELHSADHLERAFTSAIDIIYTYLGAKAFRPKRALNAAVFDSVMVGVGRRIESGDDSISADRLREGYETLVRNTTFLKATETGTSSEENVGSRIKLAVETFADI